MRKEDFFEVLGELDDGIVKGAAAPAEKKMNWKARGAMAACLALLCAAAYFLSANPGGGEAASQSVADIAPMVYVNDTLYQQSADQRGYPEQKDGFVYLGKIESALTQESAPTENFQANDPIVGCEVYQYGENIVVRIHGAYWLYVKYGGMEAGRDSLTGQEQERPDPAYKG